LAKASTTSGGAWTSSISFAADGELFVALGVEEGDVRSGRALRMPPGAKRTPLAPSHSTAFGRSSIHRPTWLSGVVVHGGFLLGVEGLHQVHFDLERTLPIAVMSSSVFALGLEGAGDFEAEHVDPQGAQAVARRAADGDLLDQGL
jgi:hypothetical protein